MKMMRKLSQITTLACSLALPISSMAGEVEVLHWWTSGGEAKSVAVLKQLLEESGHQWKDMAVAGGGGESAMTVLKSRVVSGDPPTAAQIKGPTIQEWGDEGTSTNIDAVAKAGHWDQLLPKVVSDVMKYDGNYVATPVNVHRVNWMWANPAVFEKAGANIPTTWEEFAVAAEKIQKAGMIPVAHGGQSWQDATTFESIVLGIGGADFFNKAFVDLDSKTLNSPTMVQSFEMLRTVQKYTDKDSPGRDWNLATAMVIKGEAGMQFMGDWAKGEFTAAGKKPGEDYVCLPAPGTAGAFTFNIDSFAMFEVRDKSAKQAQNDLARIIMEPKFQEVFNLNKGSIPARLGMSMAKFDSCAKDSSAEFVSSSKTGQLVPSMAHGMSTFSSVQGAIYDTVTAFFNSDMSAPDAARKLAAAVQGAK